MSKEHAFKEGEGDRSLEHWREFHKKFFRECLEEYGLEFSENMNKNNINIWDEIYPCEFFKEDIEDNRLYIMEDNKEIVSVFVLCDNNSGENSIIWKDNSGKALYIDRLGVNVKYLRKGIGSVTLKKAIFLAKDKGAQYLRLFVVDTNTSVIEFYEKNGFVRADGVYDELIDEELTLHEFGYEKLLVNH